MALLRLGLSSSCPPLQGGKLSSCISAKSTHRPAVSVPSLLIPRQPSGRPFGHVYRHVAKPSGGYVATGGDNGATSLPDTQPEVANEDVLQASTVAAEDGIGSHPVESDDEADLFASREMMQELQDRDSFGQRGEIWFVLQVLAFGLVLFPPVNLKGVIDALGALFLLAGIVFVGYGLLSLGRNLYPLPAPRAKNTLVTTGMYSYVRHPMYAGLMLAALGVTCITGNETRLVLTCGLWYILERKIGVEEGYLTEIYKEKYEKYKTEVKKLIPFVY